MLGVKGVVERLPPPQVSLFSIVGASMTSRRHETTKYHLCRPKPFSPNTIMAEKRLARAEKKVRMRG